MLLFLTAMMTGLFSSTSDIQTLFPEPSGWQRAEAPALYDSSSLYQYINGAAESYLSYNFRQLAVANYENPGGDSVSVEIYQHATPRDGFGIYSQEKPQSGNFLNVGAEGYGEPILLNFVQGRYYIKMNYFGNDPDGLPVLKEFGHAISGKIPDPASLPDALTLFPEKHRKDHSRAYIAQNFLGHSFLHSAFIAEYTIDNQPAKAFILDLKDAADAGQIAARLLKLGNQPGVPTPDAIYFIKARYIGDIAFEFSGARVLGVVGGSPEMQKALLADMGVRAKGGRVK
ncbi:MAG: hypothetical protein JXQ27_07480 [Acidobacteria bacterium]|nr:hypothetical protein [Acidobacteriota bacterium]